tara:strand:- start:3059 stop:3643 length:585 start_codon:yes stop_codon:yes gene_type:complete
MKIEIPHIIKTLKSKGYLVFEEDTKNFNLNIVGIRTNDDASNKFNDWMVIFWKFRGYWNNLTFPITTDPGVYWREHPMNIKGTAILAEGQHRGMWKIGKHQGKYPALRQNKPCTVIRDSDKDAVLDFDGSEDFGVYGINHHKAGKDSTQVDKWSAGCQVQPNEALFLIEMEIFREASEKWGNSFTYTLIHENDL